MDYKTSGVDIEAGYKSVELMKEYVKETMRAEVLGGLGGFSGAFSLAKIKEMEEPVLLSGTDGCGTKVKLAMVMDKHDTIGIDAVAMQNFTWFFFQVLFVGGAGGILVQTTLAGLGYEVELIDLAAAEIPVALVALVVSCAFVIVKDNKLMKKYYGKSTDTKK